MYLIRNKLLSLQFKNYFDLFHSMKEIKNFLSLFRKFNLTAKFNQMLIFLSNLFKILLILFLLPLRKLLNQLHRSNKVQLNKLLKQKQKSKNQSLKRLLNLKKRKYFRKNQSLKNLKSQKLRKKKKNQRNKLLLKLLHNNLLLEVCIPLKTILNNLLQKLQRKKQQARLNYLQLRPPLDQKLESKP